MPERIPYSPVPTAKPAFEPTPKIAEHFPEVQISDAVGRALQYVGQGVGTLGDAYRIEGHAWDNLGKSFDNAGDMLFKQATAQLELDNRKKVDDALLQLYDKSSDIVEKHAATLGQTAVDAAPAARKDVMDLRNKLMHGLPSQVTQREFQSSSINVISADFRRITGHAGEQERKALIAGKAAKINMDEDRAAKADTPEERDRIMKDDVYPALRDLHHFYGRKGDPDSNPESIMDKKKADETVTANAIEWMGRRDPTRAMEELEKAWVAKNVDPKQYEQLYGTLRGRILDSATSIIQSKALGPEADRPLEDARRDGLREAAEYADKIGHPDWTRELQDSVDRAVIGQHGRMESQRHDTWTRDNNDLHMAITNSEEWIWDKGALFAKDPTFQTKFNQLPYHMQKELEKTMAEGPSDGPRSDANRKIYAHWLAALDGQFGPEERLKAMVGNPHSKENNLPKQWADSIATKMAEEVKQGRLARDNPKLDEVLATATRLGVMTGSLAKKDSDEYRAFVADLLLRLQVAAKDPLTEGKLTEQQREHLIMSTMRARGMEGKGGQVIGPTPESYYEDGRKAGVSKEEVDKRYEDWILGGRLRALFELTPEERAKALEGRGAAPPKTGAPAAPTKPSLIAPGGL